MLSNAGNFFRLWIKLLLVISSMQDFTTCILTAVLIDSDFGKILLNTHAAVFVRQKGLIDLYGRIQNPGSKYCFPDTCCWCHRDTWRCPLVSVPSCTSCRERERPLLKSEKVRIGSWKGGDGISHVCHQRNWFASCFALSLSFVIIHSLHLSPNPQQKKKQKTKTKNKPTCTLNLCDAYLVFNFFLYKHPYAWVWKETWQRINDIMMNWISCFTSSLLYFSLWEY